MIDAEPVIDIEPAIPETAISVYGTGGMDDFPILKAFQQYVDNEQAKARRRLVIICTFFALLMAGVTAIFVCMLMSVSSRNQQLNDRLVEYAMQESKRTAEAVAAERENKPQVVIPPQDDTAVLALTAKLEALQKQLIEGQEKMAENSKAAADKSQEELAKLKTLVEEAKQKIKDNEELTKKLAEKPAPVIVAPPAPVVESPSQPTKDVPTEDDIDLLIKQINGDEDAIEWFIPDAPADKTAGK